MAGAQTPDSQTPESAATDRAGAPLVAGQLAARSGQPVMLLDICDSTNRVAFTHAQGGGSGVVIAEQQRAGRGRQGRSWSSEEHVNLLFSAILRPRVPIALAPRAVLIWAAAMSHALDVRVKWPNDLVDGRGHKLGGVLAELETRDGAVDFIILGVGVNVNQQEFPGLPAATSLALLRGEPQDRTEIFGALIRAIYAAELEGAHALDLWRARSDTLGRRVRIGEIEGIASGLRDDGALLVDGHPVLTGDVELV